MSANNNNYRFGLFCVRLLFVTSLVVAPISASPLPSSAGLENRSPIPTTQEETTTTAKRTTVSGHGVLLGDGTISGGVGEIVTASGGLQTADEISSESIIVNGKPLELSGGGLTVIDGQDGSSVDGVKKNPDGSTTVDISGSDVTRGGVAIEFWRRWRLLTTADPVKLKKKRTREKEREEKKLQREPDVELEKLPLL
ncbi:hypothetical protein PGQ11_005437 [Apiospora arundinis]|uniref:Uncharacterized protein n=1 Tax=Apiospora arundinis TaxID=335852 RepID=A0ABR2JBF8_9PEZI